MVTAWPKNFPGLGSSAERFATRVANASGGSLTVRVYAAGELAPVFKEMEKVQAGEADMYHSFDTYYQGASKAFNFFTSVPFGLTASEQTAWIRFGGGREVWDEFAKQFNIKGFQAGSTGMQMGGWYNKEVKTLADFKGLKIRMPGLGGEVVRKLGGTAVALAGPEIFPALQSGAIDAAEWVGPWNDLAFGFYKVTKFYYYPGFDKPNFSLTLGVNLDMWNGLTDSQRAIIENCADAENDMMLAEYNAKNIDALSILMTKHKVTMRRFSDDIMKGLGEASGDVIADAGNSDPVAKKVYESFMKFRKNAVVWTKVTDQAFADARLLPFRYGKST